MKFLAVDIGEKRIGLAVSDELGIIASPFGFIERSTGVEKIIDILEKEKIEKIVVGVPYLASGSLGSQADDIWSFTESLKDRISITIEYENEILTSVEAEKRLKTIKKKTKGDIDSMAATIILESYLGRTKNE